MANGYIGKISALVTASTADLSRKLQGSTREVGRFANSIQSQIAGASRSAQASLNSIFTAAQKVERALQAGTSLRNKRGLALIDPGEADRIRRVVSVAEGINRPAVRAKQSFEALSLEIRGGLQPLLERMQRQVDFVNGRIEVFGRVSPAAFERTERTIRQTVVAFEQLAQAQRRLGSLATGNELEFSDPRLAGNLAAAQKAGQQAISLPAQAIATDPQISGLVQQINRVSELAVTAAAKVKASIGNPGAAAAATKEYDRLNAVLESLVGRLNRKYQIQVDTAAAQKKFDSLIQTLDRVLTGRPQNFDQVEREYQSLIAQVEKFAFAQRAAFSPDLTRLAQLISTGDLANLREAEELLNRIGAGIRQVADSPADRRQAAAGRIANRLKEEARLRQEREDELELQAGDRTDLGGRLAEQGRRRVLGRTGDVNIDSTPRGPNNFSAQAQRDIDALGARVGAVRQQLETLPNSIRTRFIPELQRAQAELINLQNSPRATVDEIERAAASVKRLEDGAKRTAAALSLPSFSEFSENFSTQRSIGELEALQQVLARIGATAGGPAARAYENYRVRLQEAIRTGTTGLPRVRDELEKLQVAAAQAAAATGKISFNNALRQIQRGGDLARGAFGNLNLVVTQAAFAVDDFFSATGGIEQRLRAVGNNISQIGFLLGSSIKSLGLWGLAIGVGVNVVAQLGVAIFRWASSSEEAEKKQKQLEAAIKAVNAALERQKQLAESIAEAYRRLGESIADAGLSDAGQQRRGRDRQIEEIQREQRDRRREVAVSVNPGLSGARARTAQIEEQLQTETDPLRRRDLNTELREIRRRFDQDLELIELGAQVQIGQAQRDTARFGGTPIGNLIDRRTGIQNRLDTQFRIREQLASEGRPTNRVDNEIAKLSSVLAQLEVAIETLRDQAGVDSLRTAQRAGDFLGRTQDEVADSRGFTRAARAADTFSREIEAIFTKLADGVIDTTSAQRLAAEFLKLAEAANRAAIVTGAFNDALERAAGDLARAVESELGSAAESLRRRANAAEASQPGSGEASVLRNAQERVEAARRDAQDARRGIEARIVTRRDELERQLEAGGGSEQARELARLIQSAETRAADQSLGVQDRNAAQIRAEELRAQLQSLFEQDSQVQELRGRADGVDIQAQREQQQVEQAIRGRELSLTPGQRAAEELSSGLEAIRQFYGQLAEATTGLVDFEAQAAAQQRFIDQSLRSAAPAIFGLADQVANAVLQGPSRAALQATDVSTVEGSRELNRLLRGDDAARDQNLVELQKQSTILEDMLEELRNGAAGVANQ